MAKKKIFTSSFKGFDYAVSVPSATFEGESASDIKDKIQEHLMKWYGTCYKELIDKFQKEFKIEVSNGKEATIMANYENGWTSLGGSILQQVNEPIDDSKRIKFPVPGTDKFSFIEDIVEGVLFSEEFKEILKREVRDNWLKVRELTPEEVMKSWEQNDKVARLTSFMSKLKCENIHKLFVQPPLFKCGEDVLAELFKRCSIKSLHRFELTEEGKGKYRSAGFHKGSDAIKHIQEWIVKKTVPILLDDHKDIASAIQRGLLEITETLDLEGLKSQNLATDRSESRLVLPTGASPRTSLWGIESSWRVFTSNNEKFVLLKLTPSGQIKYNEGIDRVLNREETERIEGKTF